MTPKDPKKAPWRAPISDLLWYMRHLRREGEATNNRIMRRLAQPERVEHFVEFFVEHSPVYEVDTIVVSDLHLGSSHSLADALRAALSKFTFNRLILNGDIFDHLRVEVSELNSGQRELLAELQDMSRTHEVVWIEGNHDNGLQDFLQNIVPATVHRQYAWEYQGKRYLALHGDQFDYFSQEHPVLYTIGTKFYAFVQWLGPWTRSFAKWIKRETKWYTNAILGSIEGARAHGRKQGVQAVFCGHTHHAYQAVGEVSYYNSGGWTEGPCHLIAISDFGVQVHAFSEAGEHLGALSPMSAPLAA